MNSREFLLQVKDKKNEIESMRDKIEVLASQATHITQTLTDMPGYPYRNIDPVYSVVAQKIDLEEKLQIEIDEYLRIRKKVVAVIYSLSDPEFKVLLYCRYIELLPVKIIYRELKYRSEKAVYYKLRKALKAFDQAFSEKYL